MYINKIEAIILEKRSRLNSSRSAYFQDPVSERLFELEKLVESFNHPEIFRHIVISCVSTLETFHRSLIVDLIDKRDEFKKNAIDLITDKFKIKDFLLLQNKNTVTFGELISSILEYSRLEKVIDNLDKITGLNFHNEIITPYEPVGFRDGEMELLVDYDLLGADSYIKQAYQWRHILAHEAAPDLVITKDDCVKLLKNTQDWVAALNAILYNKIFTDIPLTTVQMNMVAHDKYNTSRGNLCKHLTMARKTLRSHNSYKWIRKYYLAWRAEVDIMLKNLNSDFSEGTMWNSIIGYHMALIIQSKADELQSLISFYQMENAD